MNDAQPKLRSRLLIGAIAGFAGTLAMTAAMSRLHRRLPSEEQYPLTPREIIDSAAASAGAPLDNEAALDATTAAHFAYGAATGSLIGAANCRLSPVTGGMAGVAVWVASYLGWIPGVGLLKPATAHPPRRNLLMIAAHVVWGVSTARAMRELLLARETMLAPGEDADVPAARRRKSSPRSN